ncbi:MAG: hypothetical protein WBQ25_10535 [Nitrososphaeraceae archaeon]
MNIDDNPKRGISLNDMSNLTLVFKCISLQTDQISNMSTIRIRYFVDSQGTKIYEKELDLFSKYLSLWVVVCIIVGTLLGYFFLHYPAPWQNLNLQMFRFQ